LARECLARWAVPLAVAVYSLAYPSIYYAQELKQYSLELCLTIVVLWLAAKLFKPGSASNRVFVTVGAVGFVAIFMMHAMPFLLAGIGGTALWMKRTGKLGVSYTTLSIVAFAWLAAFALNYIVFIRHNYSDPLMKVFWAFAYPGKPWSLSGLRSWYVLIDEYIWYLGYGRFFDILFGGLVAAGLWAAARTGRWFGLTGAIILATYWLAASAGRSPFYGRLILWMFPLLIVLAFHGASVIAERWRLGGFALAGLLLWPTLSSAPQRISPIEVEGMRDVAKKLSQERKSGEPVYVLFYAQPGLRYYQRQFPNLRDGLVLGKWDYARKGYREGAPPFYQLDMPKLLPEIKSVDATKGFWILLDHLQSSQEAEFLRILDVEAGLRPEHGYSLRKTSMYYFGPSE
jgi:hypothetical protein